MPRKKSARKYLLTINNPQTHGFDHARIRSILSDFPGIEYWCMCDETGEQGTYHTHIYAAFRNSVMFDTVRSKFYGAHIDPAKGKHRENRDYIRKEGKWLDDAKHETNHPETFEEWGELPPDKGKTETQAERIMQLVKEGKTNAEILEELPTAYNRLSYIEQSRQTLLEARYKDTWRDLRTVYIWGDVVHIGPLVIFALSCRKKVCRGGSKTAKRLEPKLCMLLLIVSSLLEDSRDLLEALLLSDGRKVGVLVPCLRLACEGSHKILFCFRSLEIHDNSPL